MHIFFSSSSSFKEKVTLGWSFFASMTTRGRRRQSCKWYVRCVFFYSTFVCPTEIHAFNNKISELRKLNTEVVAVSVDSQFAHLAWINTPTSDGGLGNISFPLLSDLSHEISKSYGVFAPEVNHAHRYDILYFFNLSVMNTFV